MTHTQFIIVSPAVEDTGAASFGSDGPWSAKSIVNGKYDVLADVLSYLEEFDEPYITLVQRVDWSGDVADITDITNEVNAALHFNECSKSDTLSALALGM